MHVHGTTNHVNMVRKGEMNEVLKNLQEAISLDTKYMESAKPTRTLIPSEMMKDSRS